MSKSKCSKKKNVVTHKEKKKRKENKVVGGSKREMIGGTVIALPLDEHSVHQSIAEENTVTEF